jgi:quercetin dioxygenase-like cupin family protein
MSATIEFRQGFQPDETARLKHTLTGSDLFSLDALVELARRLPQTSVEWNAGDLSIDQDPSQTPSNGLSPAETIARIRECRSWLVLKNVEQSPAYNDAMESLLTSIEPYTEKLLGPMFHKQGYIFVSSPGSVTPFHMDPEHNILLQIAGEKTMRVFPASLSDTFAAEYLEDYHAGAAHRNLKFDPAYDEVAVDYLLAPGDALYVPVKAPHLVRNGDDVSVSFSITWRSRSSVAESELHQANRWMRARGGSPPQKGARPVRDRLARLGYRVASKLGVRPGP